MRAPLFMVGDRRLRQLGARASFHGRRGVLDVLSDGVITYDDRS